MKLSTKQIQQFNGIKASRQANVSTLNTALHYYATQEAELNAAEQAIWQELAEIHNLDLANKQYTVQVSESGAEIVEVVQDA